MVENVRDLAKKCEGGRIAQRCGDDMEDLLILVRGTLGGCAAHRRWRSWLHFS